MRLQLNNGSGSLQLHERYLTGGGTNGLVLLDGDQDGDLDWAVLHDQHPTGSDNRHRATLSLVLNRQRLPAVPGDLNGDGRVTLHDPLYGLQTLTGQPVVLQLWRGDLDGDGKLSMSELIFSLQKTAGAQ